MPPSRFLLARALSTRAASLSAPVQAALYMTAASFLFALMNGAIRLLGDGWGAPGGPAGGACMHPSQTASLRNVFALLSLLPCLAPYGRLSFWPARLLPPFRPPGTCLAPLP